MLVWAIKDRNGRVLREFVGSSRIEVGCKVLPGRYDAFRLHVSASYRELFERVLQQVLASHEWRLVRTRVAAPPQRPTETTVQRHMQPQPFV